MTKCSGNMSSRMDHMCEIESVGRDAYLRYMVHHRVPDPLQKRVKKWFDYSWGRTHGVDETSLLETLPDRLRARIQVQIHLKTLKKVFTLQFYKT